MYEHNNEENGGITRSMLVSSHINDIINYSNTTYAVNGVLSVGMKENVNVSKSGDSMVITPYYEQYKLFASWTENGFMHDINYDYSQEWSESDPSKPYDADAAALFNEEIMNKMIMLTYGILQIESYGSEEIIVVGNNKLPAGTYALASFTEH
jgi:virulence-associated protein VagC